MTTARADIAIVGCGAAGLYAGIWAGRTLRAAGSGASVVGLDGAKKLGAKILVAGGGRCNVTHHAVDETAYAGSSRNAVRNVLRRHGVAEVVRFFDELGVTLKREETGKLFPTTDDAHTVLGALLRASADAGVALVHPWRVHAIERTPDGFLITPSPSHPATPPSVRARRVILATGGMALPRTGSDGHGYSIARALGHSVTPHVFPALVPLVLDGSAAWLKELSGLTLPATLELLSGTGKRLVTFTNSTLLTHFGLSGPGVLDISRYYADARRTDPGARLVIGFLPGVTTEAADAQLAATAKVSVGRRLAELVPERLARALCARAGVEPSTSAAHLKRDDRRALATLLTRCPLPVTGDRGFTHAEVTAGGVPLAEVHLDTMESRVCPGLHLCGELLDVDGRIGGFNFQWAWATGHAAGAAAAKTILAPTPLPGP